MKESGTRSVKAGKSVRMSYSRQEEVLEIPSLIEVQKDSCQQFLDEGLKEVSEDISPIVDLAGHLSLEFTDFTLCKDDIKYTIEGCKERDATYAASLKVEVQLCSKDRDEINEHRIFMDDLPLMTDTGSLVIDGAERVVVSQLIRSPGIYYGIGHDKISKELYTCTIIPNGDTWLGYETNSNDILYIRVNRTHKVPVTVSIRALGYGTNAKIIDLFGEEPKLLASFGKDISDNYQDGLLKLYKKIRPGEPLSVDSAESLLNSMFFDPRRYDSIKVDRYKFNKKLHFKSHITGHVLVEDIVDVSTGETLAAASTTMDRKLVTATRNAAVPYVWIQGIERSMKVLSNMMVDLRSYVNFKPSEAGVTGLVFYPVLESILAEAGEAEEELKTAIHKNLDELVPKHITKGDILASINYNIHLEEDIGTSDDIDHPGNHRVRAVGELLQNQYHIDLSRIERVVRERMTTQDMDGITPQSLTNIKPVTTAVEKFFGSSQLPQFMGQGNPLAGLTHKGCLPALGPGGLLGDHAGFEVRDVHYTHYGRMCPIETPEGPNIGLVNSLTIYMRVDEYGFIKTPYRIVNKTDPNNPVVTDEMVYLTVDEEDNFAVARTSELLDGDRHFVHSSVSKRFRGETSEFMRKNVDLMDVSPKMVLFVATSMIPLLENDDANRALMGSNMQRQAVPLLMTGAPVVGTGVKAKATVGPGVCQLTRNVSVVERSVPNEIIVKRDSDGNKDVYYLTKFKRSNQSNCYNQKPIVFKSDHVGVGEVIADGPSTQNGEIALGKNPLIGFMTWKGYNYGDAVLLNERLVQEDVYTSVHIKEYEAEARDTKLGPEEITRDVPDVGEGTLKNLDEGGVIRIGTEVRAGDILVGRMTLKGETELTTEERLLRAIFGKKAREMRDTSLKVSHGACGIIVDAKVFTKGDDDELSPGANQTVRIYIAQKRKISVGNKMTGRHGNKGVVSRVLPAGDMPFLPNGHPLDTMLDPLGVPSRINIGQVLEIHLSLAAKALRLNITTPIFDGADEIDIMGTLGVANGCVNLSWGELQEEYKNTLKPEMTEFLGGNLEHRKLWGVFH